MFLESIASSGLIQLNPDTNVLKDFPVSVKKIIVSQVVTYLKDPFTSNNLSTLAHIRWVMETCGQGFTLGIEEEQTIQAVTDLYRRWIFEGPRPPCIEGLDKGTNQIFIQDILRHYSMIFQPRPGNVDRHAPLCSRVLEIYLDIGRIHWRNLSLETWELFLRLLLGVTDSILSPNSVDVDLGKRLCSQVLKVLFELWLHSRTRNPDMWTAFKKSVPNWFHHERFIDQWNTTTLALTTRSVVLMYGNNEKERASGGIQMPETPLIKTDDDYIYYSWHRFLYIIDNPNRLQNPLIFLHAFQGIEKHVQQYLFVPIAEKGKALLPDGNTILHIFGHWLFEAIFQDRPGFEEGTALAVKILCTIICTRPHSKYLPVYLGSFYQCMSEVLKKEGRVLISAIMHCQVLFNYEIEGSRVLVPSFIFAIGRIIQKKVANFEFVESEEIVRRACTRILFTLFALPNNYGNAKFQLSPTKGNNSVLESESYLQLKQYISVILLEALRSEVSATNIQMLLYTIFAYSCEDINNSSDFTKQALALMTNLIVRPSMVYPTEVTLTAIRVLTMVVLLYPSIENGYEQAVTLTSSLCKYIISQCDRLDGTEKDKDIEQLVAEAFQALSAWFLLDVQWFIQDRDLISLAFKAIVVGLTGKEVEASKTTITNIINKPKAKSGTSSNLEEKTVKKKGVLLSDRIREAADYLLVNLVNQLGNFPPSSGPSRTSTLVTEEDLLMDTVIKAQKHGLTLDPKKSIRYFFLGNSAILTALDRPFESSGHSTTIILRDKTGKYAWNLNQSFLRLPLQNTGPIRPHDENQRDVSVDPFINPSPDTDPNTLTDVYSFFDKRKEATVVGLTGKQVSTEKSIVEKKKFGLNVDIAISPPDAANPYAGDLKLQQSRLLMNHLGFVTPVNRQNITLVDQNSQFFRNLQMLDNNNSERECQKISVVYVAKGQNSESEYMSNLGGPLDYQEFVSTLGWGVKLSTHNGFLGDKNMGAEAQPYYATYNTEIMFQVATLIPNSTDDNAAKKRLIASAAVTVVWTDDTEAFKPNYKTNLLSTCHIFIHPLPSGLYCITVVHRAESPNLNFGPLIDGMVVSKHSLGLLVRETAINAYRAAQGQTHTGVKKRERFIADVIAKYKKDPITRAGDVHSMACYGIFEALAQGECGPALPADASSSRLPPATPFPNFSSFASAGKSPRRQLSIATSNSFTGSPRSSLGSSVASSPPSGSNNSLPKSSPGGGGGEEAIEGDDAHPEIPDRNLKPHSRASRPPVPPRQKS